MKKVQISHFTVIFFLYISVLGISISSMYIEITIFATQQYILYGSGLVFITLCLSTKWLNWGEIAKIEVICHNRCGTIKIPLCSNAVGAKHMSTTYSPFPYDQNILQRNVKQLAYKQATLNQLKFTVIQQRKLQMQM